MKVQDFFVGFGIALFRLISSRLTGFYRKSRGPVHAESRKVRMSGSTVSRILVSLNFNKGVEVGELGADQKEGWGWTSCPSFLDTRCYLFRRHGGVLQLPASRSDGRDS
jgi:hypothetical protein